MQYQTPDDGQKTCPKHVGFYSKNKLEKLVHLVGFITRIYQDARSHKCQKNTLQYLFTLDQLRFQEKGFVLPIIITTQKKGKIIHIQLGQTAWHLFALQNSQHRTYDKSKRVCMSLDKTKQFAPDRLLNEPTACLLCNISQALNVSQTTANACITSKIFRLDLNQLQNSWFLKGSQRKHLPASVLIFFGLGVHRHESDCLLYV